MEVFDSDNNTILRATLSQNRTFQVKISANQSHCPASVKIDDQAWLWHLRSPTKKLNKVPEAIWSGHTSSVKHLRDNATSQGENYVPFELLDEQGNYPDPTPTPPPQNSDQTALRKSNRTSIPNRTLQDYDITPDNMVTPDRDIVHLALFVDTEPVTYAEASKCEEWRQTTKEEIDAIERNHTWDLVNLPTNKKPIMVKWIYRLKHLPDGTITKYKA
ncbi:CCHC-type integrase-like protein, partial [Trifolium medium]|nr:CCHC-type integrase-like protein [Trifolium medium]